jgi:hypothetical protein
MSALPDLADSPDALDQLAADYMFDPGPHFGEWLESLEGFRNRERAGSFPEAYLEAGDYDLAETLSLDDQLPDSARSKGTLVVTEYEEIQADVEVTVAVIDGIFKGKIKATEHVFLENHALVIGEINTPALTIQGGAIIEGRCYFEPFEQVVVPLEHWERPG